MNWRTEWRALHDRIAGLERAFDVFVAGLKLQTEDPYGIRRKVFRPEFLGTLAAIRAFRASHEGTVSTSAIATIDRFLATHGNLVGSTELDNTGHLVACVTALSALRTELGFQLTSRETGNLRTTERALQHLQRSIVVDAAVRDRWREAFASGEVECEQLGAAHLLAHGIWAFKVSAAGERTDLVYNEPIADLQEVVRASEALVLTEWKVVRNASELTDRIEAATRQIDRYSAGILAGVELVDSRFVVVVSSDHLPLPADTVRNGATYRVRGIAVSPASPSKAKR